MVQLAFTKRILAGAKQLVFIRRSKRPDISVIASTTNILSNLDLVLLDIKSSDPETYR